MTYYVCTEGSLTVLGPYWYGLGGISIVLRHAPPSAEELDFQHVPLLLSLPYCFMLIIYIISYTLLGFGQNRTEQNRCIKS